MMSWIQALLLSFWSNVVIMAPYLLFGFLLAGVLSVIIPPKWVKGHLGGPTLPSVTKASLFGVPLPLCSCGVIPVTMSLRKSGASKPAAISFLLSTPQTGVDSILVTWSLLGPIFAIYRPIIAFFTGLLGGVGVSVFANHSDIGEDPTDDSETEENSSHPKSNPVKGMIRHGFYTLPRDVSGSMLLGLAIAALIAVVVPDDFFAEYLGSNWLAMPAMLVLGIPIYVCSAASVPVAAALIVKGLSPGAAIVFLMTGPATNAVSFTTVYNQLGKRTAIIYILTVVVCALLFGTLFDFLFPDLATRAAEHVHAESATWIEHLAAVALLGLLAWASLSKYMASRAK